MRCDRSQERGYLSWRASCQCHGARKLSDISVGVPTGDTKRRFLSPIAHDITAHSFHKRFHHLTMITRNAGLALSLPPWNHAVAESVCAGVGEAVALPTTKPTIRSERRRYALGDVLEANCSLPPSRPTVEFSFTLNNLPVSSLVVNIFELGAQ
ncbi:hypothetical protein PV325_007673 [Microctonus aethiopoides]|nr:hypothetical protein PV325_007673 [Microctonus aethiopoides]